MAESQQCRSWNNFSGCHQPEQQCPKWLTNPTVFGTPITLPSSWSLEPLWISLPESRSLNLGMVLLDRFFLGFFFFFGGGGGVFCRVQRLRTPGTDGNRRAFSAQGSLVPIRDISLPGGDDRPFTPPVPSGNPVHTARSESFAISIPERVRHLPSPHPPRRCAPRAHRVRNAFNRLRVVPHSATYRRTERRAVFLLSATVDMSFTCAGPPTRLNGFLRSRVSQICRTSSLRPHL